MLSLAGKSGSGAIVLPGPATTIYRATIIEAAARHHIPTVYNSQIYVTNGGLLSYSADNIDLYGRAASYVDRILKGEKPGNLPVQAPTKFKLVVNLKTAKALGLTIPEAFLLRADEVIE
jgi:putative ABC transport system substrate-binding protein